MNISPLLSVVVPCYNAANYIERCVNSLVSQTYSNLEIVLVDDGSTDSTPAILDDWQNRDTRIRVIHKNNEGANIARSHGVQLSTGEFITFADSDDWLEPEMYQTMMEALLETGSDMVQCSAREVFDDGRIVHRDYKNNDGSVEVVGHLDGVLLLLDDSKWFSWLWNKICKKSLFVGVDFTHGNEDLPIAQQLMHNASQSVYVHRELYNYYQRGDSIVHNKNEQAQLKFLIEVAASRYGRYLFTLQHPEYHAMLNKMKFNAIFLTVKTLRMSIVYPQFMPTDTFEQHYSRFRNIPLSIFEKKPNFFTTFNRIELTLLSLCPPLYRLFIRFFRKHILKDKKLN